MARALLLLPTASYRTTALLAAAGRCGVEVTVASEEDSSVGHLNPSGFLTLDFSRPDSVVEAVHEFHRQYPIDAVLGVDDTVVEAAAVAARALGLPHNPLEAVTIARDKARARQVLAEAGVPCPAFVLRYFADAGRAEPMPGGFPVVVKPLSLAASRGVIRANDETELAAAIARLESILEDDAGCETGEGFLVEQFVSGPEVALEGLLRQGHLEVLAVFDKPDPLEGPYFEETIYLVPSGLDQARQREVSRTTEAACEAIGLVEGAVHVELRVTEQGPVVIEVNPRAIGGLCSDVLRFGTGVALEDLLLNHALGDVAPLPERVEAAAGVMMLPVSVAGTLVRVDGLKEAEAVEGVERVAISAHPGQWLQPLPEGSPYLGFLFARGKTCEDVENVLRTAFERLTIVLEKTAVEDHALRTIAGNEHAGGEPQP